MLPGTRTSDNTADRRKSGQPPTCRASLIAPVGRLLQESDWDPRWRVAEYAAHLISLQRKQWPLFMGHPRPTKPSPLVPMIAAARTARLTEKPPQKGTLPTLLHGGLPKKRTCDGLLFPYYGTTLTP